MLPKYIQDIKDNKAFLCLHDGYREFNYGCPWNAIQLTYCEYAQLNLCLKKKFNFDINDLFKKQFSFDFLLPSEIQNFVDKTVIGSYLKAECFFDDEFSIERAAKEKEKLLLKVKLEIDQVDKNSTLDNF